MWHSSGTFISAPLLPATWSTASGASTNGGTWGGNTNRQRAVLQIRQGSRELVSPPQIVLGSKL